jgi:lysophospholipase L1-like esterase
MQKAIAFGVAVIVLVLGLSAYLPVQVHSLRADVARSQPSSAAGLLHTETRLWVIRSMLSRVASPIVVMGDSIVEAALLPSEISGHPVINAGIGGTGIGLFEEFASSLIRENPPALVVLLVGINDALGRRDLASFRSAYLATLQSIKAPIAVATIAPSNSPAVDVATVRQFNDFLKSLSGSYAVIDVSKGMQPDMTTDGVHLDATGYRVWTQALVQGIEGALSP